MNNLKMSQKLGLGFGSLLLLVCFLGYISFSSLSKLSNGITIIVEKNNTVSSHAVNLYVSLLELRENISSYLSTEKEEYNVAMEKGIKKFDAHLKSAKEFAENNPELRTNKVAVYQVDIDFSKFSRAVSEAVQSVSAGKKASVLMLPLAKNVEDSFRVMLTEGVTAYEASFAAENYEQLRGFAKYIARISEASVAFKEIRRLYFVAFPTYSYSVKADTDRLFSVISSLLAEIKANLSTENGRSSIQRVEDELNVYRTALNAIFQGWETIVASKAEFAKIGDAMEATLADLEKTAFDVSAKSGSALVELGDASTLRIVTVTGAMMVIGILLTFILTTIITKPIGKSMRFAQTVAAGNLDDTLDIGTRDEIGKLADALRSMVTSLKAKISEANEQAKQAQTMGEEARAAMEEAKKAQAAAESAKREGILAAAQQLEGIVEVVSSASTQLSAHVEESERGAAISSERLTETATAMEEMNATVLEVARSAGSASQVTTDAKVKAEQGAGIVENVVRCINDVERQSSQLKADMVQLGQQAEAIGTIMNVISDIADQTNLLALNAAIEAARAGEAGRGFAVVADEVRKLAEKTMQATVEVGNAIRGVQHSADKNMKSVDASSNIIAKATELVHQAGAALQEIVQLVETSADQVRTIATAAEEQSSTSEEINRSLGTVSNASLETARAMAEAAQAVSDLSQQAQQLSRLIDAMKRS